MTKRRLTLRLKPEEIAVVDTLEWWQHLIQVYSILAQEADTPEDREAYLSAEERIRYWVEKAETPLWDES